MRNVKNTRQCDDIPNVQTIPEYTLYKTIPETSMDGFCMVDKDGTLAKIYIPIEHDETTTGAALP